MDKIRFTIRIRDREPICGERELVRGSTVVALPLPEGVLEQVSALLRVPMGEDEKVFMNGYQTWTYCPEYGRAGYTRDLGPLPELLVRGTGLRSYGDYGFVDYPQKPGITHGESWCYFRDGERFRLFASLDEHPGYTLFRYDASRAELSIRRDCGGLRCGGLFHAFDLFYAEGTEQEVFDAWMAAMDLRPRTDRPIAGWSSWYNRYQAISRETVAGDLAGAAAFLQPGDVFQIDDGWEPAVGDWLEPDGKKFPDGMKAEADRIHAAGLRAGLWLAPFVAQRSSRLRREHPDWLLRVDGRPWLAGIGWGGFFALDIDRPEVVDYLRRVFHRVLDEWGYDLVKLDFLYAAAPVGGLEETRAGRMIRALELLRELCGDRLILGCGVPLMPAFGLVDYCRIGCDVGLNWNGSRLMQRTNRERVSTRQAIGNTIFRRQLNGRAWLSDPDVFFLREDNIALTWEQKQTLATVESLFGGVLFHSDDMSGWTEEAHAFYRRLLRIRQAQNVRVHADRGLRVSYGLDGKTYDIVIE